MKPRTLAILLTVATAGLVVIEFWLLAIANYRKMTPVERNASFVALAAIPIIAWTLGTVARRKWRLPTP